jgi:hypothetical protein
LNFRQNAPIDQTIQRHVSYVLRFEELYSVTTHPRPTIAGVNNPEFPQVTVLRHDKIANFNIAT